MGGQLAQAALAFKGLADRATRLLTGENKTGTLLSPHPSELRSAGTKHVQLGWALQRRIDAMIAAFGTLAFLATLWLLVVVGAAVLEESGAKIAAALKGKPPRQPSIALARIRVRARPQLQQPMRATASWRAAA
jgi:hypothetical protein